LVFGITALLGTAEIFLYFQSGSGGLTPWDIRLRAIGLIDYLLIIVVAFRPAIARDLGIELTGIQVEAILVTGLLVIGVHMVFLPIIERPDAESA